MATFSIAEWETLTPHDKHTLKTLGRVAPFGYETLAKFKGVGLQKIQSLIDKGLAEEGRSVPRNELGYGLTEKGHLALEWCNGNRLTEFPKG